MDRRIFSLSKTSHTLTSLGSTTGTSSFGETEGAVKEGEIPTKTVEEVLAERKQKAKKIKENLKDKKNE